MNPRKRIRDLSLEEFLQEYPRMAGGAVPLTQVGAYPLLGTGPLPNVDVASPGEVWAHKRANGVIVPGSCVRNAVVGGVGCVQPVVSEDSISEAGGGIRRETLAIAMRQIMMPDINPGSQYNPQLGPNEIVNLPIADMDWVRTYHTGVMNLTLVAPDADYAEGDILGWDPSATRPAGKASGTGAWASITRDESVVAGTDIFVVDRPPRFYGSNNESILTCRFLRSNQ